ncbi:047R [Invertebrate iridescent virus 6]|uniref:047R n=1 Tax=Invertebrate iridescent virus 6 TaxID=176652 RepID=Q91G52_IIV6|nr:047R [Invertebrate iridescent virus 6]AAK81980.1 047R [Invertebrate iridescent virus 6]QMS79715.1 hypothetical protein IIV6-T1_052 [Invertebrate iridescent virus 6]
MNVEMLSCNILFGESKSNVLAFGLYCFSHSFLSSASSSLNAFSIFSCALSSILKTTIFFPKILGTSSCFVVPRPLKYLIS